VLVGADDMKFETSPDDLYIIGRFQLVRWLRKQPATLDAATTAGVFGAARKSTIWQIPN